MGIINDILNIGQFVNPFEWKIKKSFEETLEAWKRRQKSVAWIVN